MTDLISGAINEPIICKRRLSDVLRLQKSGEILARHTFTSYEQCLRSRSYQHYLEFCRYASELPSEDGFEKFYSSVRKFGAA